MTDQQETEARVQAEVTRLALVWGSHEPVSYRDAPRPAGVRSAKWVGRRAASIGPFVGVGIGDEQAVLALCIEIRASLASKAARLRSEAEAIEAALRATPSEQ